MPAAEHKVPLGAPKRQFPTSPKNSAEIHQNNPTTITHQSTSNQHLLAFRQNHHYQRPPITLPPALNHSNISPSGCASQNAPPPQILHLTTPRPQPPPPAATSHHFRKSMHGADTMLLTSKFSSKCKLERRAGSTREWERERERE